MVNTYAYVNNGVVENIIVCEDQEFHKLLTYLQTPINNGSWIKVSDDTGHAVMGGNFDYTQQKFYSKQPYPSWNLDRKTLTWVSPVEKPSDDNNFVWEEKSQQWIKLIVNECSDCSV